MANYTLVVPDNLLIKDGLGATLTPSDITTALSTHSSSFGGTVAIVQYYGDREKFEIEYDHHPLDPKPNNTVHLSSALAGFVAALDALHVANYVAP